MAIGHRKGCDYGFSLQIESTMVNPSQRPAVTSHVDRLIGTVLMQLRMKFSTPLASTDDKEVLTQVGVAIGVGVAVTEKSHLILSITLPLPPLPSLPSLPSLPPSLPPSFPSSLPPSLSPILPPSSPQVMELGKLLTSCLFTLFSEPSLASQVSKDSLMELLKDIMTSLVDENTLKLEEAPQLLRTFNCLVLKICDNGEKTAVFG